MQLNLENLNAAQISAVKKNDGAIIGVGGGWDRKNTCFNNAHWLYFVTKFGKTLADFIPDIYEQGGK